MTIDTGKRTVRMQSQKQLFAIITALISILIVTTPLRRWLPAHGVNVYLIIVGLICAYVAYYLYFIVMDVEYIMATDTQLHGMLRVRHFKLRPFEQKKNAIEFPLHSLYKYEVERRPPGRRYLVLFQTQGNRVYQYPPISLSILRRSERIALLDMLDKYVRAQR